MRLVLRVDCFVFMPMFLVLGGSVEYMPFRGIRDLREVFRMIVGVRSACFLLPLHDYGVFLCTTFSNRNQTFAPGIAGWCPGLIAAGTLLDQRAQE